MAVHIEDFKAAMGRWGSGVSIITTRGTGGEAVGFTASSFTSLSLEPPMVLFCLAMNSTCLEAFQEAKSFAVNILQASQEDLSNRFAGKGGDKFAEVTWREGELGMPLLAGCLASLECRIQGKFPGGDHLIFIGGVEAVTVQEGNPLLYYRGEYHTG